MREQNVSLFTRIEELQAAAKEISKPIDYTSRFDELQTQNTRLVHESNDRIIEHVKNSVSALIETEELRREAEFLRAKLEKHQEEHSVVRHRLETALSELKIEHTTSSELSRHLKESKERESQLTLQASTIVSRFENGQLVRF